MPSTLIGLQVIQGEGGNYCLLCLLPQLLGAPSLCHDCTNTAAWRLTQRAVAVHHQLFPVVWTAFLHMEAGNSTHLATCMLYCYCCLDLLMVQHCIPA